MPWKALILLAVLSNISNASSDNGNQSSGVLSIPPSLYWDGNDGQWSTFQIQVGTPGQTVRLLPGTSANAGDSIWVVIAEGCTEANPGLANCASDRGYVFLRNQSSTWSTEQIQGAGLYQLDTFEEGLLGLTGNAYYGFDQISLGLPGSGLPTVSNVLIAGYATNDYWLGSLGLSPIPFNFTNLDTPIPSLLTQLRNTSAIRGSSWAYTNGAAYQNPPVYGSLVLGGYDASRFDDSTTAVVPFGQDFSRDLLLGVQSITYNSFGSTPLLASPGIYAFIDSMVSHLWLPVSVCTAFEEAFNLTWNESAELYLLDEATHSALLAQNPTFTFTIGASASSTSGGSNASVDIVLPYSAFDLSVSAPFVNGSQHYFPLKRAANSSQYTLGRVFLQEAHVFADYDRHEFHVSQALFPSDGTSQQLVAVNPPDFVLSSNYTQSAHPSGLSTGATVGIGVGCGVLLLVVVAIFMAIIRRRRKAARAGPPLDSNGYHDALVEAKYDSTDGEVHEAPQQSPPPELSGDHGWHSERKGLVSGEELHEAPEQHLGSELPGNQAGKHRWRDNAGAVAEVEGTAPRIQGGELDGTMLSELP